MWIRRAMETRVPDKTHVHYILVKSGSNKVEIKGSVSGEGVTEYDGTRKRDMHQ